MNLPIARWLCVSMLCGIASFALPGTSRGQDDASATGRYSVETNENGVVVRLNDQLVAQYWNMHTAKPIIWPLVGVHGNEITRGYPMRDASDGERDDHVHHRSFWLTHGEVNGFDFWAEGKETSGKIVPDGEPKASGGSTATIEADHNWVGPDGERVLSDHWKLTFAGDGDRRWIDCVFRLTASNGDVHFGDTKEGTFGIRVAGTMKVDAKKGGEIVSAEGIKNQEAWGKAAPWVDYHGPVEGKTEGIAIMNHPDSFGYPCRWHVRTYGLFAANPFGVYHFTGQKEKTEGYTLPSGESLTLAYRVYLHSGDTEAGKVAQVWDEYRQQAIPTSE